MCPIGSWKKGILWASKLDILKNFHQYCKRRNCLKTFVSTHGFGTECVCFESIKTQNILVLFKFSDLISYKPKTDITKKPKSAKEIILYNRENKGDIKREWQERRCASSKRAWNIMKRSNSGEWYRRFLHFARFLMN